ncbi:helix-turn-helix domain-containing protein [Archangium violaceum]|uniref:type II TA system antitoxin MqsA family protein n=1 Tax=Archangium violaceum TaxID=83451 RepID=UPI002B31B0B0|nr:helix-turn-helix domain-containing protein [Archangium violaceum]
MNCSRCGGPLKVVREDYNYNECGLDDVLLVNVKMRHCASCGDRSPVLGSIEELHTVIARQLALKKSLLTGKEIRFLRKYLGYSAADYARQVGVTPETISRWENEKLEMAWTNELLLRVTVVLRERLATYESKPPEESSESPLKRFEGVNKGVRGPKPVRLDMGVLGHQAA